MVEDVLIRDLATGEQRPLVCIYQSSDAGSSITSYGGGLFTVEHEVSLIGRTSGALRFLDLSGEEVSVEHNPFAESCAPCELDAALSPDGRLLAYAYWPTASIARAEPADGNYTRALDEWWEASKNIPTELMVLDLSTGEEVWRTETVAQASLVGFDGRFVTVVAGPQRGIYDTQSGERVGIPAAMTVPAAFWTVVLASLGAATHDYGDAHAVAADLAFRHGVETGVVWSDGWLTLEDGYWAVITGRYDSQEEAAGMCGRLGLGSGDCYPKYVATADTIDPEIGLAMVELRADGLGLVDFEDPVEHVKEVFSRVVGSAPRDGWSSAAWVDYVGWHDYGLYVGFSTPEWTGWDGVSRLIGWEYSVGWGRDRVRPPTRFETLDGVTLGTTVADLRRIYGESLRLPVEEEACLGWVVSLPDGVLATFDGPPSHDAEVVSLFFGVGVGC